MRLKTITESLNEAIVTMPDIPNTQTFWHGGNLDEYDDIIAQKGGRYEYGPGLYITDHYGTAKKYAKGSRKLYMITVENGQDINDAKISLDKLNEFVDSYVIGSKKKEIKKTLASYAKNGEVRAYLFNNMMVNEKAVKSTNTKAWREFLVDNGIDYEIVSNAFGWGERMMVLYNMKKIKKVQQISPKDKIEDYDMLMEAKDVLSWDDLTDSVRNDIAENIFDESEFLQDQYYDASAFKKELDDSVDQFQFMIKRYAVDELIKSAKDWKISKSNVNKLMDKLGDGDLDPILLNGNKLFDGGHRLNAYHAAKKKEIPGIDISNMLSTNWEKWFKGEI